MNVSFADADLDRLETDASFNGGWADNVVRTYRKRLQIIRNASDERDFRAMKSLHYEKLKGPRQHQHSMRINDQYRLVIEIMGSGQGKLVTIISIEDYH